ncbi:MAG: hypothetical protein U0872_07755 [Planctomycetaceae bacterium]
MTNHRARQFGTSKYGLSRTTRVILDLLTVKYLIQYAVSPMKLFGYDRVGLRCGKRPIGNRDGVDEIVRGVDMTGNPLPCC